MKKVKYLTIIICIIIFVLIIALIYMKKEQQIIDDIEDGEIEQDTFIKFEENSVKEDSDYVIFSINDIIQNLFNYIDEKNNTAVYNMTNMQYISSNKINTGNVFKAYTDNQSSHKTYYVQEVYKIQNYQNVIYYIYGYTVDNKSNILQDVYIKMKVLLDKNIYSIEPLQVKEYDKAKSGTIAGLENIIIEPNSYNTFELKNYSSSELAKLYMQDYIMKFKYYPSEAFNLLDDDYKKKNFTTINKFQEYIQGKYNNFKDFAIRAYNCDVKENAIQYDISDSSNRKYTIIVYKALDYKVIFENN